MIPEQQTCESSDLSANVAGTTPGPLTVGLEHPQTLAWREFFRLCRHYAAVGRERERQSNTVKSGEETLTSETA